MAKITVQIHDIGNAKIMKDGQEYDISQVTKLKFEGRDTTVINTAEVLSGIIGSFTLYPEGHFHPKRLPMTIVRNRNGGKE